MISERLKDIRKIANKTQKEFANELGVSERNYKNYEYGNSFPSEELLKEINYQYNVSLTWLLTGRGEIFEAKSDLLRNNNSKTAKNFECSFKNFGKIQEVNNLLDSEMARILGITEHKYIKISSGKEKPTINILIKLKENFNINIDRFLFGSIELQQPNLPQHNAAEELGLTPDELLKLKRILKNY